MTLSLETVEIDSIGAEPLEVLGFKNQRELEEALIPLMQKKEIDPGDIMAA